MCQYRRLSGAECCVLSNESDRDPLKGSPPPPFIDTRRDSVHAQRIVEVIVFSPNCGGAVVEHCGKYTVWYGAGHGSCPGHHPWSCGDHDGVLAAVAGGMVAFRGSCKLVKAGVASESCAHAVRGFCGRESTKEA